MFGAVKKLIKTGAIQHRNLHWVQYCTVFVSADKLLVGELLMHTIRSVKRKINRVIVFMIF